MTLPAAPALTRALGRPGRLAVRPGPLLATGFLLLVALAFVWPSLLAPAPPDATGPDLLAAPSAAHPLGTDQLGRDLLSRIVHGARPSLTIGLGATAIGVSAGSVLGVLAATAGRAVDEAIMRVSDVFLAFPGLLLALLVVAVLGPGTGNATLAIGCSLTPGFVRLARSQALLVRESDYVRAAVVLGRPPRSLFLRHLMPNALPPVLVLAMIHVGTAIIAGSSLSFLGLGPAPPTPEWGAMLAEGREFLDSAWTVAVFPGVAVTATVVSVNVAGRALQRRFEGRLPDVAEKGR
ncbi:peptide/nickel transport system permease protein [Actinomadura meyerae]|jgi:peptide/nickel transport system permease protein|uniref:Peptide/nickel transport system permease protein n=1 Tax=Actinomadura meyerae TaxID=240840 RepID=A0A239NGK8_9ACTN|nr:ABC transporter permease [Actinomadura meyerae]SNT53672.1 peptide/nickel transport system permease protein [Actinomadura meyerae]